MPSRPRRRTLRLHRGEEVVVRPVRADDKELLASSFERLSPESRYRRFFSPVSRLSASQLRYLTEVDHRDHEALVALDPAGGAMLGVARYVRSVDEPDVAEVAVTVADDWQGRGLGSALLDALADRAREEGIRRVSAVVQQDNVSSLRLMEGLGESVRSADGANVELLIDLPERGGGAELQMLLRGAAARSLVLAGAAMLRAATFGRPAPDLPPLGPPRPIAVVVAGTDGSASAQATARLAVDLTRAVGGSLHLVSAYNPWAPAALREAHGWVPEDLSPLGWLLAGADDAEAVLRDAARAAAPSGVPVTTHARRGEPAEALIAVAEELDADLIVVGSKSMRGRGRHLLGSVAAKVSHHAPCSVLVARP